MSPELEQLAATLRQGAGLCPEALVIELPGCRLRIRSNSAELIDRLGKYFDFVRCEAQAADIEVLAIDSPVLDTGLAFTDWSREPGKTGRKDAYHDLPDGRLVHKVRTGMLFLQSETLRIAAGPCRRHDNQVINFINSQYMNRLQQRGWLICHAAALCAGERGMAIAGFSGGGKSTLMLHMLEHEATAFLSNDRVFIRRADDRLRMRGIAKLPRINPGTLLNNPRLHLLATNQQLQDWGAMASDELWHLEEKFDVPVARAYGEDRIRLDGPLTSLVILNWRRDSSTAPRLQRIDLHERAELLAAVMKSPGPFYQYADGRLYRDGTPFDEAAYRQALAGVAAYEVTGRIDFDAIAQQCCRELLSGGTTHDSRENT
jgi:HprK-related kinase B